MRRMHITKREAKKNHFEFTHHIVHSKNNYAHTLNLAHEKIMTSKYKLQFSRSMTNKDNGDQDS